MSAPPGLPASDHPPDETSKLKTFAMILRRYVAAFIFRDEKEKVLTGDSLDCRFIGVSDIATARFSLPAQLLEPIPNLGASTASHEPLSYMLAIMLTLRLEFWNYLDRPEVFVRYVLSGAHIEAIRSDG